MRHDILNLQSASGDSKVAGIVSIASSGFEVEEMKVCTREFKSFCEENQIIWNGTCFCLDNLIKNYDGICVT